LAQAKLNNHLLHAKMHQLTDTIDSLRLNNLIYKKFINRMGCAVDFDVYAAEIEQRIRFNMVADGESS